MAGHITRILSVPTLLAVLLNSGHSQELSKAPAFEVASITPCEPGTPEPPGQAGGMVRFTFPGGRFQANAVTLKFLFEWGYGIQPFQHSPGPSWMENDRYDVIAKAEGNATEARIKLMLRTLLTGFGYSSIARPGTFPPTSSPSGRPLRSSSPQKTTSPIHSESLLGRIRTRR